MKQMLQIYSLLGCLISSLVIMVCFGVGLINLKDLIIPDVSYRHELIKFQSPQHYIDDLEKQMKESYPYSDDLQKSLHKKWLHHKKMDLKALEGYITVEKKNFLDNRAAQSISSMLTAGIWFISALIFLLVHVGIYRQGKHRS